MSISAEDYIQQLLFVEQVLMIGDDIVNDVGGSKACGLKGVQVRTGKYRYVLYLFSLYVNRKNQLN